MKNIMKKIKYYELNKPLKVTSLKTFNQFIQFTINRKSLFICLFKEILEHDIKFYPMK